MPIARNREFRVVMRFMDNLMYGLIAEPRSGANMTISLISCLRLRDEHSGVGLSDQELRDEALRILAAGHETTANAFLWAWYLARDPFRDEGAIL